MNDFDKAVRQAVLNITRSGNTLGGGWARGIATT